MKPKLTKITTLHNDKENYEQSIHRHLEELTTELKSSSPHVLLVMSVSPEGLSYHALTDNSALEVLGALEVLKNYFLLDHMGE